MTKEPRTWTRAVDCRAGRRQALRAGIAELPQGVTWDLRIVHQHDCETLAEWSEGELRFCTCEKVTLEAKELG